MGAWQSLFVPRRRADTRALLIVEILGLTAFVCGWWTAAALVHNPLLLPTPAAVVTAWLDMFVHYGYSADVVSTLARIGAGLVIGTACAVPIGLLIGTFEAFRGLLEPLINVVRYMPASAFLPLLILLQGIGESEKVTVIWFGVFFQLSLMVADAVRRVPTEMLDTAYTLGVNRVDVVRRILFRAALPDIVDSLRIIVGWAWTYVVVAEIVAASSGIGYFMFLSEQYLRPDQILAGICTIGALAIATDIGFRALSRMAFPYAERFGR